MSVCKKYEYIFNEVFKIINSKNGIIIYRRYLILFNSEVYIQKMIKKVQNDWTELYLKIKKLNSTLKILIKSNRISKNKIYNGLFFIYNSLKHIKSPTTYITEIKNIINHPHIYDICYYLFYILSNIFR